VNGLKKLTKPKAKKKFVYLISPTKIVSSEFFYNQIKLMFKLKRIAFFQLRLKKESKKKKFIIAKKIKKICMKYKVKFIINDDPYLTKKLDADGCHLGQKDTNLVSAKKILKKKIIGITCHNSKKLIKKAIKNKVNYIALGAFFLSKTKRVKHKANINILKWSKKATNIPIVAIGGINSSNYKKLLLNKANFLAISGYIWNNKKYKPVEALERIK